MTPRPLRCKNGCLADGATLRTPVTARPRRKALLQSRGCARNIAECFFSLHHFFPNLPLVGRHSRRRSAQTSQEVHGQRGFERIRMWLESVQAGRGREAQRAWRQHRCSARRPDRRVERPLPRRRPLVIPRVQLIRVNLVFRLQPCKQSLLARWTEQQFWREWMDP